MTIWIVLGAITLLLAGFILWPIIQKTTRTLTNQDTRAGEVPGTDDGVFTKTSDRDSVDNEISRDLAVYRDQLSEIDRDIERGVLSTEQATAARIEVQRRILAADQRVKQQKNNETPPPSSTKSVRAIAAVIMMVFIAGGIGLYLDLGNPTLPDRPIASRADEITAMRQVQTANQDRRNIMDRAVNDLSQKLLKNPDDLRAWELLGASLMTLGRPEEAQTAFLEAVKRSGRNGDYLAMYAESLVRANNGQINAISRGVLSEAEKTDSTDPRIQYYLGLGEAQDGNFAAAIDRWIGLANSAPGNAGWLPMVVSRINEVALAQGINIEGRLDIEESMMTRGPSQEEIANAEELTPEERQEMVISMVRGLAERLETEPDNPDGWARLMQAYMVLGQEENARLAYQTATEIFAGQPDLVTRFASLASEIGVPSD